MPVEDYLAGAVLLGAMLAGVGAAAAVVVRRRLGHLDRLEAALAAALVGTVALLAVHLVPLALGVLSRATVITASALAGAGALLLVRRAPAAAAADAAPRPRAPAADGRASRALGLGTAAIVAIAAAANFRVWAGRELTGVDALTFHMPNVARWIESGSLWQIDQFLPLLAHGNYPNSGDVVLLSAVLPWHNDFFARFVVTAYVVLMAVAVGAIARELGAPRAAAVLAGALAGSISIVGRSAIPLAMPDAILYATFAAGTLFLLRHVRAGRTSDLVLGALGLGVAFGTKWYGVTTVAVVALVWAAGRLRARRAAGAVLREGAALTGIVAAVGGIWLVRNWVESGNPVFPVEVAPFGVTIFAAPRDALREQVGFSIADYATRPGEWGTLTLELLEGLSLALPACALALVVALVAGGRAIDRRVLGVALAAIGVAIAYAVTPYTALGTDGEPLLADANTRYLVPALLLAAPLGAWAAGRLRRGRVVLEAFLALAALVGAYDAFGPLGASEVVVAAVVLAAAAGTGWALWRLARTPRPRARLALAVVAPLVVLVALTAGYRANQRVNDARYLGIDPAIDAVLRGAPEDRRIGLAGLWTVNGLTPIWPSFGTRIGNEVEYVGHIDDGFLRQYAQRDRFLAALRAGDYDLLVVGRGLTDPPRAVAAERWALSAGWRTVAVSERLRALRPPA